MNHYHYSDNEESFLKFLVSKKTFTKEELKESQYFFFLDGYPDLDILKIFVYEGNGHIFQITADDYFSTSQEYFYMPAYPHDLININLSFIERQLFQYSLANGSFQ